MEKIKVLFIVTIFILSGTSLITVETNTEEELSLMNSVEQLLTLENIKSEELWESISYIDNPKKIFANKDGGLINQVSKNIIQIQKFYERMEKVFSPNAKRGDGKTEYWAVLIGVDYGDYIDNVFVIDFEEYVEDLKKTLLVSEHWQNDHIRVLTDEKATVINILLTFLWLILMEDSDDVSLVYFGAHGLQLNRDIWPYDEEDGKDEYLTTWKSGANKYAYISDDSFTFLLDQLDSQGVAVILDTCYSGGMIDGARDLSFSGRVIITSSKANESSWPMYLLNSWLFPNFLFKGLSGPADLNNDMKISAEEAYKYAEYPTIKRSSIFAFIYSLIPFIPHEFSAQHPQIFDGWPSIEDNDDELNLFYI